ncbi:MAG: hypothetical protein ACK44Q_12590, partial [Pirellulaceae bacterium]
MKYKSTSAVSESRPIWTVPSGATYGVRISLFLKLSLALLALCGGMVFALGGQVTEAGKWDEAIRRVIDQQQRAWNEGSIERFMDHYLNSDDLTFSSGG